MIEFESTLKILVSLNDQFKFEDDYQFSDLGLLKEVFIRYKDMIERFDVFVYTHKLIKTFESLKSAKCTSLFYALEELKLILNNKSRFVEYLQKEHDSSQTSIKSLTSGMKAHHDDRVQEFKEGLAKFAEEN